MLISGINILYMLMESNGINGISMLNMLTESNRIHRIKSSTNDVTLNIRKSKWVIQLTEFLIFEICRSWFGIFKNPENTHVSLIGLIFTDIIV